MSQVAIRSAREDDLPGLTEICNHYVTTSAATFDTEPSSVEQRRSWFEQFAETGPHRLIVAEEEGIVLGYASSQRFRPKAAYDTTVETTVYCAPDATGRGIGGLLYAALFDELAGEDLRAAVAAIALPNPPSIALHDRFGFTLVGVFHDVGRKLGRYWDVAWYEKLLGETAPESGDK